MTARSPIKAAVFKARAVLVGERIDLKAWAAIETLANNPLTVEVKGPGVATLSRYGVVVFFDVLPVEEMAFLAHLQPAVTNPYAMPEIEELEVRIEPGSPESVKGGVAYVENAAVERLQVIADILSKSALLSLYEKKVDSEFDRIEPLAVELDRSGYLPGQSKELLKKIGAMLLVEQRMVGRAEITEKPDVLWDNPSEYRSHRTGTGQQQTRVARGMVYRHAYRIRDSSYSLPALRPLNFQPLVATWPFGNSHPSSHRHRTMPGRLRAGSVRFWCGPRIRGGQGNSPQKFSARSQQRQKSLIETTRH